MLTRTQILHQSVFVLRPCDPPCSGCGPETPDPKRPWYIPPKGRLWTCGRVDERRAGLPSYEVADLDGYLPPDLATDPNDAAPADLWPAGGNDLSEPQMDWIAAKHPGMLLYPWGEPFYPSERAKGSDR